jgi:RimJ/RimL family protein N-acetyltransferase
MDVPDIRTERLLLRRLTRGDAASLQPLFADWDVIHHMSKEIPWPYPDDGVAWFFDNICQPAMESGQRMVWVIVPDEVGTPVGLLEYRIGVDEQDNRGFWIGTRYQGRGYMTEAVEAFQDYIFFVLGVEQISVCNSVLNSRSRRVKEKTGALRAGEFFLEHHNGSSVCERWIVTRSAWAKVRKR